MGQANLATCSQPDLVAFFAVVYGIIRIFSAMVTPSLLPVELLAVVRKMNHERNIAY